MAFVIVAALIAAAAQWIAWGQARLARQLLRGQPSAPQLRALRRISFAQRLESSHARDGGWRAALCDELQQTTVEVERVAVVNDHLGEIGWRLDARQHWGNSALMLSLFGGGLALVAGALSGLSGVSAELLAIVPLTLVAAVACLTARWQGAQRAEQCRQAADAFVAGLLAPPSEPALPAKHACNET